MASGAGALATEAPSATRPSANDPSGFTASSDAIARLPKRQRETESSSPCPEVTRHLDPLETPTKSARLALASTIKSPSSLTGAAALLEARWRRQESTPVLSVPTSPNPSHSILESLRSTATQAMSRPADAPQVASQVAPTANMDPTKKAVSALSLPLNSNKSTRTEDRREPSPQSSSSVTGVPGTETPTPMDVDVSKAEQRFAQHMADHVERPQQAPLSYPSSLQTSNDLSEQSIRGMSFSVPSQIQDSPTIGGKKHKCPYCDTEFTRHHNLKSHLLTHSQEKPYVCTECQMRFRRLHDLKRHGKLHTGEKPHVCPKCDRKFARGDALARHSKGAGGCAGRRASMGSYADGEELDGAVVEGEDSTMSGITYDNGDDYELRRQSLPGLGSQLASGTQGDNYNTHSRTYPPTGARPMASGLYPPKVNSGQTSTCNNNGSLSLPSSISSSNPASTSTPSGPVAGNAALYSQSSMMESPKPLSPGAQTQDSSGAGRQQSTNTSQQLHVGRRQSELQPRPKLPGLSHPGFAAPSLGGYSRGRMPSGTQSNTDSGNMFAQGDASIWAYIQLLEDKIKSLSDQVICLDQTVTGLKKQLETCDGSVTA